MNYIKNLKTWLLQNERNKSWLARKCNVSPTAVKYWLDHKSKPSKKHKYIINKITGIEE